MQGDAGSGQHTKMANQIVIASTMIGVSEGLAYASRCGLDPHSVLSSIRGGAAGSFLLDGMGTRMLQGDYAPGFFTEHFIKDLGIPVNEAQAMGPGPGSYTHLTPPNKLRGVDPGGAEWI